MKLFRFHRPGGTEDLSDGQLRFAGRLAALILSAQRRLADYLNRVTREITPRHWLKILCCFVVVVAAYLLYLIVQVFI